MEKRKFLILAFLTLPVYSLFTIFEIFCDLSCSSKTSLLVAYYTLSLLLVPALSFVLLKEIFEAVSNGNAGSLERNLFYVLFIILIEGYGLHFAANLLDLIQHPSAPPINPSDPYSLVQLRAYFLDEILGHKLMFIPLFGILLLTMLCERPHPVPERYYKAALGLGSLFGAVLALVTIEGQSAVDGIAFAVLVVIVFIEKLRDVGDAREIAFSSMMLMVAFSLLLVALAWRVIFGGFVQPSQLWRA